MRSATSDFAPTELEIILGFGYYKYFAPTELGFGASYWPQYSRAYCARESGVASLPPLLRFGAAGCHGSPKI